MKLTTTKLFIGLFALTAVAVIGGLLWLSDKEEPAGNQNGRLVKGPGSMLERLKKRQRTMMEADRQRAVMNLANATNDAGLGRSVPSGASTR